MPPSTPVPTPIPQAGPQSPFGSVLPSVSALRSVGIPLLVYAVFGSLAALWAVALYRRVRGSRRT